MLIQQLFGTNVFSPAVMARYLSPEHLRRLERIRSRGEQLTMDTADAVAEAM